MLFRFALIEIREPTTTKHKEWLLVLACLVHQYSEIRDLISCPPALSESRLFICSFGLYSDPLQYDPKKDLACVGDKSNCSVICTRYDVKTRTGCECHSVTTWCLSTRHVSFMRYVKKYADRKNTQYSAEIWYRNARHQLPHLIPQGSGHMAGAILLATGWSR